MSDRTHILLAIRNALGRQHATGNAPVSATHAPGPHVRPMLHESLETQFVRQLREHAGTLTRVSCPEDVPGAVEAYRAQHGLARQAAVGAALAKLPWPQNWRIHHGPAVMTERLSVTPCVAAIAETGSLMLAAGPDSPTTHNFVPDDHIVVLHSERIVPHLEDAWRGLREEFAPLPRAVNLISGPSRTADVALTIQLGAHGPRRMHVILVAP